MVAICQLDTPAALPSGRESPVFIRKQIGWAQQPLRIQRPYCDPNSRPFTSYPVTLLSYNGSLFLWKKIHLTSFYESESETEPV
jgi:hypothetical protein